MVHDPSPIDLIMRQIQAAMAEPETANIKTLWAELESCLVALPQAQQLYLSAQAIAHLTAIIVAKADHFLNLWEHQHRPSPSLEPIVSPDLLTSILRQSAHIPLDDLIQEPPKPPQKRHPLDEPIQSQVEEIDKAKLLQRLEESSALGEIQTAEQEAIAILESENISAWAEAIAHYIQTSKFPARDSIPLIEIQSALNQPLVEIWLGLILGEANYQLQQQDPDFYSPYGITVWIPPC
jgi:hypothetical protein